MAALRRDANIACYRQVELWELSFPLSQIIPREHAYSVLSRIREASLQFFAKVQEVRTGEARCSGWALLFVLLL